MSQDPIRVVLVGCGGMADTWVTVALDTEGLELVGLVDLDRSQAEKMADKHVLSREVVFDSLAEAVRSTRADAVFDVTVPKAHPIVTLEALDLGCHVLGEKPMAEDIESARKMVSKAAEVDRVYAVLQNYRTRDRLRGLADFTTGGALGELAEAHCEFYIGAHFGGFRDEMAHPLLGDMSIHHFDMARCVTGLSPTAVTCQTWKPKQSWYAGDVSAFAMFEMTGGLMFTYRGSWCSEGRHTTWNGDWRVIGQKGSVTWRDDAPPIAEVIKPDAEPAFITEKDTIEVPDAPGETSGHAYLIPEFVAYLRNGRTGPLSCPCDDNIKSLAMVLGAIRSADEGRQVEMAELLGDLA
ncbi:MAG: Gfo/Idh/MocA family oxidoreductase [Planctomycetota bacterium]